MEKLYVALGMIEDPEAQALAALRAHQEATGMKFADPDAPVAAPPEGEFDRDEEYR